MTSPSSRIRISRLSNNTDFLKRKVKAKISKNKLEIARQRLHVSAVPDELPFREDEAIDISYFVENKLTGDGSGCMYVAGVPGTGKTATVTQVIKNLQESSKNPDSEIPEFDYVEINGMRLTDPKRAYIEIVKQLSGKTLLWNQAYEELNKRFSKKSVNKKHVVLVVDELDVIYTKKQEVVYNIVDWPSKTNARLIVIAIANTMDLPERLSMSRVASRLGFTRRPFEPYNFKQLEEIVKSRLSDIDCFQDEAIQLVARKVAAVSGDARRALDICRRATEIASDGEDTKVTIKHVNTALSEMITSDSVKILKNLPEFQKLFLQAVSAEMSRLGVEETLYDDVVKQFNTLCTLEGLAAPAHFTISFMCQQLHKQRLIVVDNTSNNKKLYLNISPDDLKFALNEE